MRTSPVEKNNSANANAIVGQTKIRFSDSLRKSIPKFLEIVSISSNYLFILK